MQADLVAISMAFILGFCARLVGLPPLVGYLVAGFMLFGAGMEITQMLREFANIGVTLLLFTIGLKLRLSSLLMPQIWAVASLHMLMAMLLGSAGLFLLGVLGLSLFAHLSAANIALLAFALSFSSTVFAVKVLESKGEMNALYGRIAIGILIVQDIAAVVFLAASTGKLPSVWALLLLGLLPLRWVLFKMLERSGHGELLILFGLSLAVGGAAVFEMAGVKGDLGALILGVLLAGHARSSELARHLLGFKDLFLVGFFLTIGLSGPLEIEAIWIALLLLLLVPIKGLLFIWLLARFKLRTRTSLLTSLSLANYSEFGLIVAAIGVSNAWISSEWLIIIAITLSLSFILAAPLNTAAYSLYARFRDRLQVFDIGRYIEEEQAIDAGNATVLIFGMGRVGGGAYDHIHAHFGDTVLGVDLDLDTIEEQEKQGRRVIRGSATDLDFWERVHLDLNQVKLVMLALPNHQENLFATAQLKQLGYSGKLAAIAKYSDEAAELREAGADAAFNLYAEAGAGFADDVYATLSNAVK